MPRLTPATRAERRDRILAAAARCFQRHGFHGTTIPDICDEAGVSTGAVYTWFDSKGEIVEALAARAAAERRALLDRWTTPAELAAGLAGVVEALPRSTDAMLDVHLWSAALTEPALRRLAIESFTTTIDALTETLRPATTEDPRGLAGMLLAAALGIEVLGAIGSADTDATVAQFGELLDQVGNPDP